MCDYLRATQYLISFVMFLTSDDINSRIDPKVIISQSPSTLNTIADSGDKVKKS